MKQDSRKCNSHVGCESSSGVNKQAKSY